jgi:hypothetical protein
VGELRSVRDELVIVLAESSQTTGLWLENAEM